MELNEEQLKALTELAALLLSPDEIALILEVKAEELKWEIREETGPIYTAYISGKLKTKSELHKSVLSMAKQGSGPAQTMAVKMLADLDYKNLI